MAKLSICIIANNEEKIIESGILSILPAADEIIFVDTGCTDSTPEIMAKYTDKIYKYTWIDDFSDAYNFAHSKASHEYAIAWNADYVIDKESANLLIENKTRNFDGANVVNLRWNNELSSTGEPLMWVYKPFIIKPKEIEYYYPDHSQPRARDGKVLQSVTYPNIAINESSERRDKSIVQQRKQETIARVKKFLSQNPDDIFMREIYVEELFFCEYYIQAAIEAEKCLELETQKQESIFEILMVEKLILSLLATQDIEKAQNVYQKYISKFAQRPEFILIRADLLTLTDLNLAKEAYLEFLQKRDLPGFHNQEQHRSQVHPYLMLAKIALSQADIEAAIEYFETAKKIVLVEKYADEIDIYLNHLKTFA